MMVRVRLFGPQGHKRGGLELLDEPGTKWIDVFEATEGLLEELGKRYGLHKLAIEDCLHLDQRPKLEEYPNHQFIVLQGFSCGPKTAEPDDRIILHEMHFFLGADWVISVHAQGHSAIDEASRRIDADPAGTLGRGADFVTYLISDALVDGNFPMLDELNDELEELELAIFEKPGRDQLKQAFALKHTLVRVRRVLSPQRDVVGLLSRAGVQHVNEKTTLYFRDVYDHLVRLYEQIDASRDLLGNAMDGYLSVVANKTNDVTKQLTLFASIFMPLSFVVGFFGQNFEVLGHPGFMWTMVGIVAVLPPAMVYYFFRKRWL